MERARLYIYNLTLPLMSRPVDIFLHGARRGLDARKYLFLIPQLPGLELSTSDTILD
jgi:hypothetical protein